MRSRAIETAAAALLLAATLTACKGTNGQQPAEAGAAADTTLVQQGGAAAQAEAAGSQLVSDIREENRKYPLDTGGGIVIDHVELIGPNVTYVCIIDESQGASVEGVMDNAEQLKDLLIETMAGASPEEKRLLRSTAFANLNLCYSYRGQQSGQQYDIIISTEELMTII